MDFKPLTNGERFFIRRKRLNLNQEDCAKRRDLTRNQYGKLERDAEGKPDITINQVDPLTDLEKCLIKRRRSSLSQAECAAKMNITRFWFNQMETGRVNSKALIDFWG